MGVCKFFLQGNCRYGNNCKFEHPRGGGNQYKWVANDQQKNYFDKGGFNTQNRFDAFNKGGPKDTDSVLLQTVAMDMNEWSQSNMWPFSCYGLKESSHCVTGFEDVSPEEIRFQFLQATKPGPGNTANSFLEQLTGLVTKQNTLKQTLKQPDASNRAAILAELKSKERSDNSTGNTMTQSTFGGMKFGTQVLTGGLFGKPANDQQASVFGGGGGNNNLFGKGQTNNLFGKSDQSATNSTNLFGKTDTSSSANVFGSGGAAIGAAPSNNPFGSGNANSNNPGLFGAGAAPGGGVFGQSTPSGGVFGNNAPSGTTTTLFGKPVQAPSALGNAGLQTNNLFGKPATTAPSASGVGNLFGAGVSAAMGSGSGGAKNDDKLFTPMDQLTADEKEQFSAQCFSLGKIPLRPPPKEMVS